MRLRNKPQATISVAWSTNNPEWPRGGYEEFQSIDSARMIFRGLIRQLRRHYGYSTKAVT